MYLVDVYRTFDTLLSLDPFVGSAIESGDVCVSFGFAIGLQLRAKIFMRCE